MERYEAPAILGAYSAEELAEEAATCQTYEPVFSDRGLKDEVEEVGAALEGVRSIRTR